MGLLNRRRPEDRQESQSEQQQQQQPAKENAKAPKRDRLKRGLTKDGFTSFLRPVQSNSSASSISASQDAAAVKSDAASYRGNLSRSQTLPDITVQPPGATSQQPQQLPTSIPKLFRTATIGSTTGRGAASAETSNEPTDYVPRRRGSRFTPSLPNIRDTLKISKTTGRRKSSPAVPEVGEIMRSVTPEEQPASHQSQQQQTLDPSAALGSWTPDPANHGSRPPSSPEMSAVGSVRSGRSRFFPSLQNIREHTGPALRLRSRGKNSNRARSSVRTQTDDEGSPRHSKEASHYPEFLLDRRPPGSRPSSAPGQLQEPKIDLLIRNPPPLPRTMDSSTQTEVAPEEPEQLEPLEALPEDINGEATDGEDNTDNAPNSEGSFRLRDHQFKPSSPKRTMSLPSVTFYPGSFDKDTESYFAPRPRRSSDSSSYRRSTSASGSERSPSSRTSIEVVSPRGGTTLMTASAAWKSFNKANMSVKRQRQATTGTEIRNPSLSEYLADLPIPDTSTNTAPLRPRQSIRDHRSTITTIPTPPPSITSAGQSTLFAEPGSTGRSSMSTTAGITAAVVGALAGAMTVASRWSSPPSSSSPGPISMTSVGEASPFSSASVDSRKIRKTEEEFGPFGDIKVSQKPSATTPARKSLLEAAQSEVAWQKHWGLNALKEAHVQDVDTDGLEFDEELAAFQPDRPQKDLYRRNKDDVNCSSSSLTPGVSESQTPDISSSRAIDPLKSLDLSSTALERLSAILRHLKPSPSQTIINAAQNGITEPLGGL